jgi:hypothetical protein
VHSQSTPPATLQRAVDQANAAIRAYLRQTPGGRLRTAQERAGYETLVAEYNAAVRRLHGARETQDEPARGLMLTA